MHEPRAADLNSNELESAVLGAAVGDYADEAAVLLLINFGHWLPQLASADLITLAPDIDGDGLCAQIAWPDLEPALSAGLIFGSSGEVRICGPPPASPRAIWSISATWPQVWIAAP